MNELILLLRQSKGMTARVFVSNHVLTGVIHEVGVEIVVLKAPTSSVLVSDGYVHIRADAILGFELTSGE